MVDVLVVGAGAREHALVRALSRSPEVGRVLAAPGNGGIASETHCEPVRVDDVAALTALAVRARVGLVVVGPEAPLVAGLADALAAQGIATFGPTASSARLEGSKVFAKGFMKRHGVPTASFEVFDDADRAEHYVRSVGRPMVIKADGLAAGKGVIVAQDADEAAHAIDQMMRRQVFGTAGARIVVEERLLGEEVSFHVVCDGSRVVELGAAQDHKRLSEGDQGPNTGGMGAYAPVPALDAAMLSRVRAEVIEPTVRGLAADGLAFRGALFIGLMLQNGVPHVLEYNVRFGDPECAVLLARLETDVAQILLGAARGNLSNVTVRMRDCAAIAVVLAAQGYPGEHRKGDLIAGLDQASQVTGVELLHAGTRLEQGRIVTAGGRVLTVSAHGHDLDEAASRAYTAVDRIVFPGAQVRRDIGWRARQTPVPPRVL